MKLSFKKSLIAACLALLTLPFGLIAQESAKAFPQTTATPVNAETPHF